MHKKRGVTWGWEDSKATLVGKESGQGGWGLIQETHFSEIAGRSQNLVPLPGHTARSLVPAIFAVQCGHALSSSQWNLGVNDVTLLRTWPLIISHVPFFMLFLLPWCTEANCWRKQSHKVKGVWSPNYYSEMSLLPIKNTELNPVWVISKSVFINFFLRHPAKAIGEHSEVESDHDI